MKKTAGVFIVFAFVLALPALKLYAQNTFEGTITWAMTFPKIGDAKHPMTINVKGDKTQTNMDMGDRGDVKLYADYSAKKIYMTMSAMHGKGMVMDMKDDSPAADNLNMSDLKATGKHETIAGYSADEYVTKGAKGDVYLWVTAGFPKDIQECFYRAMKNSHQDPNMIKAMRMLVSKGLVPVRIVINSGSNMQMSMEFIKYERKSMADSIFMPPADIKFNPMPTGMGGGTN